MGVQTLNPNVKDLIGRPESHEQIRNAIHWLKGAGIRVVVDHIFGLPGQAENDLVDTFHFYLPEVPSRINSYWLRYFPRTPVVEPALAAGILTPADIEVLEEGRGSNSFTTGGTKPNKDFDTYQTMFALLPYMPRWALRCSRAANSTSGCLRSVPSAISSPAALIGAFRPGRGGPPIFQALPAFPLPQNAAAAAAAGLARLTP